MKHHVLATDYDGTLAHDGLVPESTVAALYRLRESGRKCILVTGRRLPPILELFPEVSVFDRVVAENGALMYDPHSGQETLLAKAPPEGFIETLRSRGVGGLEVGRCIVATWRPFDTICDEVIVQHQLDWQITFNKDAVMLLPRGINKASGLARALDSLGSSSLNAVAVGDAENDADMLRSCQVAVAVENALQTVKEMADLVMTGPRGAGVEELIERILEHGLGDL